MSVRVGLGELLAGPTDRVHSNWPGPRLVEAALARGEGALAENGTLVVRTGAFTGRSPQDKYIVVSPETEREVWWGSVNHPLERDAFDRLMDKAIAYLRGREIYVTDGFAGADARQRLGLRVVTEQAWHALFASTLFLRPTADELG